MRREDGGIIVGNKGAPKIMEVIGEDGQKVADYIDRPERKRPYHILQERYTNAI